MTIKQLHLNPEQRLAAKHMVGPMLVLAGAGAGKTRVVTCRIVHLLEMGIPASKILALTFTNKAANEMRHRIKKMSNHHVLISTFHSLGARILRESIVGMGYQNGFTIYDEHDSLLLLKACLSQTNHKDGKKIVKSLRIAISNAKNDLLSPHDVDTHYCAHAHPEFKEIFMLYQDKLKEYNAVDFDDLLYLTVKLFQTSKETLHYYQERWSFILIDEYQDMNAAQYHIAKLLVKRGNNLFVVGDPDQAIYSWRGGNISNILEFEKEHENAQVITLEQNYRSTSNILEAANGLIQHNKARSQKKLWSALGEGEKIGVFIAHNEQQEAQFIAEELLRKTREKNLPFKECAIFYRTNSQSRAFEEAFLRYQIPYIIIGGLSFYQRKEIKDILALLRIVVSDSDFLSFARMVNLPKRGLGNTTIKKLRDKAQELQLPILSLCRSNDLKLTQRVQLGLQDYVKVIDSLREMVRKQTPLEKIVQEAITLSGYEKVLQEDPETYEDRKRNLGELINKAAEWREEKQSSILLHFLEELSLNSNLDGLAPHDSVHLMTLHTGKGLEFTLACIVGMEEDLFPHVNAQESAATLEEERRLCYVGMTRAKKFLYLTASSYRLMWGVPQIMSPSSFLKEIPPRYLTTLNKETIFSSF